MFNSTISGIRAIAATLSTVRPCPAATRNPRCEACAAPIAMPAAMLSRSSPTAVLDVTAVLAQVRGDSVRAGAFAQHGGFDRIGIARAARLAECRDVIDVDVQREAHAAATLRRIREFAKCARSPVGKPLRF